MGWRRLLVVLAVVLGGAGRAAAHPALSTVAAVKVRPDGRVTVTVIHDTLAFALNDTSQNVSDPPMYALLNGPRGELGAALEDGRDRFAALFHMTADGKPVEARIVEAPTLEAIDRWKLEHPDLRLPVKLDIVAEAVLPPGAATFAVQFPEVLGDLLLTVDRPGVELMSVPLRPGEVSPEIAPFPAAGDSADKAARARADTPGVVWRYVRLGFKHIIPEGLDHALFVLGLFLLNPRLKALFWQITTFTIAHSITLTLTTFHLAYLPARIVEPAIALSIAFIAVENLVTTRVHPWRPAIAFVFGLFHGMGFASALSEVGLPTGKLLAGVLAFNVGVECGHMVVLGVAFLLLGWWRDRPWYRRAVAIPGSALIAVVALTWTVQRIIAAA